MAEIFVFRENEIYIPFNQPYTKTQFNSNYYPAGFSWSTILNLA